MRQSCRPEAVYEDPDRCISFDAPEKQRNKHCKHLLCRATYHAYSVRLFTASDIKTIILPSLLFACCTAPALAVFGLPPATASLLSRMPRVVFWLWINLLPFVIDNQRMPSAIAEDAVNKPWRPMPSRRLTPGQARTLMLCLYPLAIVASLYLGGIWQCLGLIVLGIWYNDLRGADGGCVVRNLINAAGYNCFTTGALDVLVDEELCTLAPGLWVWLLMLAGVVATTVQAQDMADQRGDAERGRQTVPLAMGDARARWTTSAAVAFWSVACWAYVGGSAAEAALCVGLGGLVAGRYLMVRTERADRTTFVLWNAWLVSVYMLPLLRMRWS